MIEEDQTIQFIGGNGDGRWLPMATLNRTLPAQLTFMGSTYGYDPAGHTYRALRLAPGVQPPGHDRAGQ